MYKRYIDDINVIFVAPDSNQEFIVNEGGQGELVRNEASTKGKEENGMEILQKVGNTIHSSIKVKTDYPSAHSDNKLPLLDIKMWNENKTDTDGNMRTVILHEFYAKDVASKSVIHAASAMPPNTRRTVLTQEVLRILLRCSPLLPWECTVSHINTFMQRMQYCEYPIEFRAQVLDSALNPMTK